ncbi:MAG TPA: CHAD domain-containing protein [Ignavibacteriaceae bacterium]|nr:CHAD domain-containing protein [Ignavibacteriaceae bacterium]
MNKKKWQIDDLTDELQFNLAAKLILKNRLGAVQEDIKEYFINDSVERLHRLRISLRRLRYSMELFVSCFEKKKFMILYKRVEALQDLSGKVRDFDVMKENMKLLSSGENFKIDKKIMAKIDELRSSSYSELKLALMKYSHSKAVKNFDAMLN